MKVRYIMYNLKRRNIFETLQDDYPEVKQMGFNNIGYDYLMTNDNKLEVRIEHKYRSFGIKVDITPAQEEMADVIALTTQDGKNYFMLGDDYRRNAKPHSYAATAKKLGVHSKSLEMTQKDFIENASTNLYEVVNKVKHNFGQLGNFI